ncbi:MAG TPA: IS1595 family transposase [Candidatus Saccharimonadales bacterium]|jgi:transposase-like protein|nr:IS1595 family transposase [Candidatus Saccharimonadales bacterium]
MEQRPKTLQQAIRHFSDEQTCIDTVALMRWPDGIPECPKCGGKEHYYLATQKRWKCKNGQCGKQFSVKAGTIFEDSPLGLDKWLMAMWMIASCKNGVSSYEIHRAIGVTQKSAWFMMHRIRLAMQDGGIGGKLSGCVEVDETFIGGKARNMHKSKRARMITGRGTKGKTVVMGFLQRDSKPHSTVKAQVIADRYSNTMQTAVKENVAEGSSLMTDEFAAYTGSEDTFTHEVINHAIEYVKGQIHTNGMENFWSLLKRSIGGTYVSVEPFHLFRYIDEQSFRFNNRGHRKFPIHDGQRFDKVLSNVAGRRVTYKELTGKVGQTSQPF